MRVLFIGSAWRLVTFLCAAAAACAHAHIGMQAHVGSSTAAAGESTGNRHSRRVLGDGSAPQRSAGIDTDYPRKHGRKCGVDSVTPLEYNLVQTAILGNWLLRNSVRGSAAIPDSSLVRTPRATGEAA